MDILKNIVAQQSPEHLILLKYLLFLTLMILLPYLSVIIGTTIISLVNVIRQTSKNSVRFSKEIIDYITPNKIVVIALGIIPIISMAFCIEQLLYGVSLNISDLLLLAIILFGVGIFSLYIYKYSFRQSENNINTNPKILGGIISLVFLMFSTYLLLSSIVLIINIKIWSSPNLLIKLLFSSQPILYFLFFISISFTLSSIVILFKYFKDKKQNHSADTDHLQSIKDYSLKTGLIFSFVQPLLFVLYFINYPVNTLSFSFFYIGVIAMLLMLLQCILLYYSHSSEKNILSGELLFITIILFAFITSQNIVAFETGNIVHFEKLKNEYSAYKETIEEKYKSAEVVQIDSEKIYSNKCSACHRFDSKLVGPAYNDVLPKYEGKREELIDFILNPRKINPEFINMPDQGLRPKEAEAVADYIIKTSKALK